MARPQRNNVDYFPHYINHGSKMSFIQNKWGNDGYATWYKIMEKLGRAENHHLDLREDIQVVFLANYCNVDVDVLTGILDFLSMAGWLHQKLWNEYKIVCSPEFLESIADAYQRRINDCINIQDIEFMYYINPQDEELMTYKNPQSKVEYSKVKKSRSRTTTSEVDPIVTIRQIHDAIMEDQQMLEAITMTSKTGSIETTKRLVKEFCNHLTSGGVKGKTITDGKTHFRNWMRKPAARKFIESSNFVQ